MNPSPQPDAVSDVHRILEDTPVPTPDFSSGVLDQLRRDSENPLPCEYDLEFISSYHDNELHPGPAADQQLVMQRIQNFEAHLPQCLPCNDYLGQLIEASETYRRYLYSLEESLDGFDVTASVMSQMEAPVPDLLNESIAIPAMGCGYAPMETLSAFLDESLPPKEQHRLRDHLTTCTPCQADRSQMELIRLQVQTSNRTHLEQLNLDLWPRIAEALDASSDKVVPLRQRSKRWHLKMTAAAAALLLLVMFSGRSLMPESLQQADAPGAQQVNVAALEAALIADQRDKARRSAVIPSTAASHNVIYQSPEAYLFSPEADVISPEDLYELEDPSALIFSD